MIAGFRRHLCPRRNPDPLRALQRESEVRRSAGYARASWAPRRWPPAIMCAAWKAPDGAELMRAADPTRDQSYFLFATTREQLDFLRFPLGEMEKREVRAIAAELGLADRRQARQPGYLLRARRRLHRYGRASCARMRPGPARSSIRAGRCWAATTASSISPSASARGWACPAMASRCSSLKLDAASARVVVGPRGALARHRVILRRGELAGACGRALRLRGEGPLDAPAGAGDRDAAGRTASARVELRRPKTRSRPARPACSTGSRVLGGGWIGPRRRRAGPPHRRLRNRRFSGQT